MQPHLVQNCAVSEAGAPQLGHSRPAAGAASSLGGITGRAALHLQQKLASLGFS